MTNALLFASKKRAFSLLATPQNVFPTVGKPVYTYVAQSGGELERGLRNAIASPGQLCLLTGPSKLGKTTLYRKVLAELSVQPIVVRCTESMSIKNFWASALEDLDFEQIVEKVKTNTSQMSAEVSTNVELGWGWIAKVIPGIRISGQDINAATTKAAIIRAELSAKNIIPVLKGLPVLLVVEDFHYLKDGVKKEVFQQWKAFVDEGVSVLVVSTTHHASDIARSNPDLRGRTRHIEVSKWTSSDLQEIAKKGFDALGIRGGAAARRCIGTESCGQPIVTQQVCQLFTAGLDLSPSSADRRKDFQPSHLKATFSSVIDTFYADYERDYERLLAGPRSGSRKYDTYGAILGAFAMEPIEFSLRKQQLVARVGEISDQNIPVASINSSLTALGGHQKRMGTMLLEWQSDQDMLHIVEPSFLFFLRQKLKNADSNKDFSKLLRELLTQIEASTPKIRTV